MMYIFCGTGGVGKTTLSASFALAMSEQFKTVLLTVDPSERLKSLLDIQYSHSNLLDSSKHPNLKVFSFNKKDTFDRLAKKQSESLFTKISTSPLYEVMVESLPKLHEYMAIQEISDLMNLLEPEVFIVDTPPGQNFLDFITASEKLLNFFNERTEKILKIISGEKFSLMSFAIKKATSAMEHLVGGTFIDNLIIFLESLNKLKDQIKIDHSRVQAIFRDKSRSNLFLVTSSEEILSSNVKSLMQEVKSYTLDQVIINRDWSHAPTSHFKALQDRIKLLQAQAFTGEKVRFVRDYPRPPQNLTELKTLGTELKNQFS